MHTLKSSDDISQIKQASEILKTVLDELCGMVKPGITTKQLDEYAHRRVGEFGATPSFYGYRDFPASICTSVDEVVIHGIPNNTPLRAGQIVGIDFGVQYHGYFSDSARTVAVGTVVPEIEQLINVTRQALENGVAQARVGNRITDIAGAIEDTASKYGYGIVAEYCGHGVGFAVHEDPNIHNIKRFADNSRLQDGLVIAIEPMLCLGGAETVVLKDGWSVVTRDGSPAAHFEHTVAVLDSGSKILV